jgi:hypothetical protein
MAEERTLAVWELGESGLGQTYLVDRSNILARQN